MKQPVVATSRDRSHGTGAMVPAPDDGVLAAALRRRWLLLMPIIFAAYSLAYLDRANYGFGAAAGLAATLHITGNQTSLLGSLFFLGYFAFQVPGVAFAKRRSVTGVVFVALIAWGLFAALTGVIRQFWLLALDRFLLGVAESVVFPALLILLTRWFTREERSRANALMIVGNPVTVMWMSAITGYLIQAYGWQKTFVIEGLPTLVCAAVWLVIVRDYPSHARWMPPGSAEHLDRVLAEEQAAIVRGIGDVRDVRRALVRGDVLLLAALYFFWSLGVYGFVLWLPTIIRQGSALSMGLVGLLSAVPYAAAVVLMLAASYISDKTQRRESLVWPFLLASGVALLGSFMFAEKNTALAFVCAVLGAGCMYAPYGPFFAIIPQRLPREVAGEAMALVNSFGALGGFFGSYFVGLLQAVTGNARSGFLLMSLSMICSAVLLLCLPPLRSPDQPQPAT